MKVERTGDGPRAFVGVHGWAGNSRTFRRLYDYMPGDASFYTMDLPGYGESEPPAETTLEPRIDINGFQPVVNRYPSPPLL